MARLHVHEAVEFAGWEPTYEEILEDMGYAREDDRATAEVLDELLAGRKALDEDDLRLTLARQTIVVFGAGPSLADDVALFEEYRGAMIASDGAVETVVDAGIEPDLIVTDLDKSPRRQAGLNARGVPLVVHGHGDNADAIERWVPELEGPVLGTCQCDPEGLDRVRNFGGFTDGDRACCLAAHFGARRLVLAGWDPDAADGDKARKLAWAERIVERLGLPVDRL